MKQMIYGTEQGEYTIVEPNTSTNLTWVDIGFISVSSIFLIITITFLTIFIKSQQRAKKKVSK